jgi:hypothetical protein
MRLMSIKKMLPFAEQHFFNKSMNKTFTQQALHLLFLLRQALLELLLLQLLP